MVRTNLRDNSFKLDDAIKERAKRGVEYIFSNAQSKEAAITATEISLMLTDNILSSSDLAINLNHLKISDDYTFKHSVDVATMGSMIARTIGMPESNVLEIATAGILHDLGKIYVPNEILNKPGKLTFEEFEVVKQHTVHGYDLLKDDHCISEFTRLGILQHHERFGGGGYPYNLSGGDISMYGRILTIADVYDALVTERPYHKPIEPVTAYEMMLGMFNNFDPSLFIHFNNLIVLYGIGTKVMLSNGEECEVIGQNVGYPLRPVVRNLETEKIYDLANDVKCLRLTIEKQTGENKSEA